MRGEARSETLRVGYAPSLTTGVMAGALEKFQTATPRVRIELADLAPREMVALAKEGGLDLLIAPSGVETGLPEFQWSELRRMSLVLVMPATHPLAKLKKIAPTRLRDLPLIGLGRSNFPEYAPHMRALLKSFGIVPRFNSTVNDGVSALFVALEAANAATLLADGIECVMPRTLIARPFSPALPDMAVQLGLPAVRPNPHAETFARLLRAEAERTKGARRKA